LTVRESTRCGNGDRLRVGIICANGVPPSWWTSVPNVVHEMTARLSGRLDFTIVGNATGRDASREIPGISYVALRDRWDRRVIDATVEQVEHRRRKPTQAFLRPTYHALYALRAAWALRRAQCDVVISVHFPQWLLPVKRLLPTARTVVWAHSADPVAPGSRLVHKMVLADAVFGCSEFVNEYFRDAIPGLGRERTYIVPNGFDPQLFWYSAERPSRPVQLLFVGSIAPEKGVHVLVDAFRELAPARPDLELVLAGPVGWGVPSQIPLVDDAAVNDADAMRRDYRNELIRRAGLYADRITFHGPARGDSLAQLYRSATVYVQPTIFTEGFGMPVLEAMACGTPAVVSRSGGLPELVDDGETGRVVPPGDSAALVRAIADVLDDVDGRPRMGARASAVAHAGYDWSRAADALHDAIVAVA
jgi:spore coat protein SA